jgi:hypothetical protein
VAGGLIGLFALARIGFKDLELLSFSILFWMVLGFLIGLSANKVEKEVDKVKKEVNEINQEKAQQKR